MKLKICSLELFFKSLFFFLAIFILFYYVKAVFLLYPNKINYFKSLLSKLTQTEIDYDYNQL